MEKIKILFVLGEDGWDGSYSETLWAERCGGGFLIDNLPFFKKGVCYQDVVAAKEISGELFEYERTLERSANSLYRVVFDKAKGQRATALLHKISEIGCMYEKNELDDVFLVAINIPAAIDIGKVWALIEAGIDDETWEAQEGDDRHPQEKS